MRVRVIALAAAALLVMSAPLATAQTDVQFAGIARSTGFQLAVMGEGLTAGQTGALIGTEAVDQGATPVPGCPQESTGCASATGATGFSDTIVATRDDPGPKMQNGGTSGGTPLAMGAEITAGTATVLVEQSSAEATAAGLTLDLTLTQTLVDNIPGLQDGVDEVIDGVGGVLDPIADEDPSGTVGRVRDSLEALLGDLTSAPLVRLGSATSSTLVTDSGGITTARGVAGGFTLVLAPEPGTPIAQPNGLAIITAGAATASASSDRTDATTSIAPSGVTISVLNPSTGEYDTETLSSDMEEQCLSTNGLPAELTSVIDVCVTPGGGNETSNGAAAAARAAGASLRVLLMNAELVNLAIGEVVVGVNSVVPQVTPPSPPPSPSPAPVLPRTGAGPLPAYVPLGLLAIGGAALVAFRRRRGLG